MYTTPTIINNNNNSNNNKLEYDELDYDGHFFRFGPKIILWANLVQKNPNCLIKMKFVLRLPLVILVVLIILLIFSFGSRISFLAKFGPKRQKCLIKMKLGT